MEKSSAVIDGRLSDVLDTNHSGLNKYASENDPNMIKIAEVLADMVRSATLKVEQRAATLQGTKISI